jgi:poly(beta-D-mannuronate) lyase
MVARADLFACDTPPPPLVDVFGHQYYVDKQHSIVDPELLEADKEGFKGVRGYVDRVNSFAEHYFSDRAKIAEARCAIEWLEGWASRGALLGKQNRKGSYEIKWTLGGLAHSYFRIKNAPGLPAPAKERIEAWLKRVATRVVDQNDKTRNNHLNWAAFAVGATWLATGAPELRDWAVKRFRQAVKEIRPDGTLELEMKRAGRALNYHAFALEPLIAFAELAKSNGLDLYAESAPALRRLGDRVLAGEADPSDFVRATGVKQEPVRPMIDAWMEPYYARFQDPKIVPYLKKRRPLHDRRIGGNATLFYGVKKIF